MRTKILFPFSSSTSISLCTIYAVYVLTSSLIGVVCYGGHGIANVGREKDYDLVETELGRKFGRERLTEFVQQIPNPTDSNFRCRNKNQGHMLCDMTAGMTFSDKRLLHSILSDFRTATGCVCEGVTYCDVANPGYKPFVIVLHPNYMMKMRNAYGEQASDALQVVARILQSDWTKINSRCGEDMLWLVAPTHKVIGFAGGEAMMNRTNVRCLRVVSNLIRDGLDSRQTLGSVLYRGLHHLYEAILATDSVLNPCYEHPPGDNIVFADPFLVTLSFAFGAALLAIACLCVKCINCICYYRSRVGVTDYEVSSQSDNFCPPTRPAGMTTIDESRKVDTIAGAAASLSRTALPVSRATPLPPQTAVLTRSDERQALNGGYRQNVIFSEH